MSSDTTRVAIMDDGAFDIAHHGRMLKEKVGYAANS